MRNDLRDFYRADRDPDEVLPEYLDDVSVEVTKPPKSFEEHLDEASATVDLWPEWKRGLLGGPVKPLNPRKDPGGPGRPVCRKETSLLDAAINEGLVDEPDGYRHHIDEYTGPSRLEGCFPPVDLKFRPVYDEPTQSTKGEPPPPIDPLYYDETFRRTLDSFLPPECSRTQMGVPNDEPGGLHFDDGKLRMDLIPPEAEIALAEVLTFGCNKYAERNWESGIKYSRLYGSLRRHLKEWALGNYIDPESGLPHIRHAFWNLMAITVFEMRGLHYLDDFTQKHEAKNEDPETER